MSNPEYYIETRETPAFNGKRNNQWRRFCKHPREVKFCLRIKKGWTRGGLYEVRFIEQVTGKVVGL